MFSLSGLDEGCAYGEARLLDHTANNGRQFDRVLEREDSRMKTLTALPETAAGEYDAQDDPLLNAHPSACFCAVA